MNLLLHGFPHTDSVFEMAARLFFIFILFALGALLAHFFLSSAQKRALHKTASATAWILLGASAATLFWYLVMLYFKHIPSR